MAVTILMIIIIIIIRIIVHTLAMIIKITTTLLMVKMFIMLKMIIKTTDQTKHSVLWASWLSLSSLLAISTLLSKYFCSDSICLACSFFSFSLL